MSGTPPRVLVVCDAYRPGYKGGSLWSVAHMVERLGEAFDFHVLTADHDYGERTPYPGLARDCWLAGTRCRVFYASAGQRRLRALVRHVHAVAPRLLYLNSAFSPLAVRLLAARRLGYLPPGLPVVLAPTGELDPAALAQKRWKKAPYLALTRRLGWFAGLVWRAADERERHDVQHVMGACDVRLAAELPPATTGEPGPVPTVPVKRAGHARLVYFSRVTPKKNLLWLLEVLRAVRAPVELVVWGPVDDQAYWQRCLAAITALPEHVRVEAPGVLPHEHVAATLAQYDALVLPSLGESFGYVVPEALAAGCPVLVSERTPWGDLATRGAGQTLPLEAPAWLAAIEALAARDDARQQVERQAARRYAAALAQASSAEVDLRALLHAAAAAPGNATT